MTGAERALLLAVRDALRGDSPKPYTLDQCNVEFDEMAPATVGQLYVAVMPGGWRPGPHHNSCGGINDLMYGVDVLVIKRIGNVPRDRLRDTFLANLSSLDAEIDKIYPLIDFNYDVLAAANQTIAEETGSTEGFYEPLKFAGVDKRPRVAPSELFNGREDTRSGLIRTIFFHSARRTTHK